MREFIVFSLPAMSFPILHARTLHFIQPPLYIIETSKIIRQRSTALQDRKYDIGPKYTQKAWAWSVL